MPSPVVVKMPGAALNVVMFMRAGKFSELVTMISAVPISFCAGTRKFTCAGETKKICAALPLTETRVPETFVGNVLSAKRCNCVVVFARFVPTAKAMLLGATAFVTEGS